MSLFELSEVAVRHLDAMSFKYFLVYLFFELST